jgi:hypothetical protein
VTAPGSIFEGFWSDFGRLGDFLDALGTCFLEVDFQLDGDELPGRRKAEGIE